MASVNKVILIGNLGKDPVTRHTRDGKAVTQISIATTESWKDKDGEKVEKTEWHTIVFYGQLAEIAGEYLTKGRSVYVEGRIETTLYEDKQGVERYVTKIIASFFRILGSRQGEEKQESKAKPASTGGKTSHQTGFEDLEDDIPF